MPPIRHSTVPRSRPDGVLLYGMYELGGLDRAPTVRIDMMTRALSGRTHTERIVGGRAGRVGASIRWLLSGGHRRVGAVYVESATSSPMPTDLAFLALMRLLGRPVGIYFRDAYQLFRGIYPRRRRRQVISDWTWRLSLPLLKRLATVRFVPSPGLARVLRIEDAVLLPPGTDPAAPNLGIGEPDVVGAIAQMSAGTGLDTLLAAMEIVMTVRPAARLRLATRSFDAKVAATLPAWVEVVETNRSGLVDALGPDRVCVLPLPVNEYTNLAVAVRLLDLLGFGKPVVSTDTDEARAILEASGAGAVAPGTAQGLADAIVPILSDEELARRLAAKARAYAASPAATWDSRAATVLATLGLATEPVK